MKPCSLIRSSPLPITKSELARASASEQDAPPRQPRRDPRSAELPARGACPAASSAATTEG
eukprot:8608128-Pyramimonas_sp.AAC.1